MCEGENEMNNTDKINILKAENEYFNMNYDLDTEVFDSSKQNVYLPMTTDELYMRDKRFDYKLLLLLTLNSNRIEGSDHRFIYREDLYDENKSIISQTNIKVGTIKKNMNKIRKNFPNAIKGINTDSGIAYIINYKDKDDRKFVCINQDILKLLLHIGNNNAIKLYLFLMYMTKNGFKQIARTTLCEVIGLSVKSDDNLSTITRTIKLLKKYGLIRVKKETKAIIDASGKEIVHTFNNYYVEKYSQWYSYMINNYRELMVDLDMNIGSCGEVAVSDYLDKNNIEYIREKTFNDLRSNKNGALRYDFYIPKSNTLIEFNGEQHNQYVEYFHETEDDFRELTSNDKKKIEYAKNKGMKLIIIKQSEIELIDEILSQYKLGKTSA